MSADYVRYGRRETLTHLSVLRYLCQGRLAEMRVVDQARLDALYHQEDPMGIFAHGARFDDTTPELWIGNPSKKSISVNVYDTLQGAL